MRLLTQEMVEDEQLRQCIHSTIERVITLVNASNGVQRVVDWFFFGGTVKYTSIQPLCDIDVLLDVTDTGETPVAFLSRYYELLQKLFTGTGDDGQLRLTPPTLTLTTGHYVIDLLFAVGIAGQPKLVFGYDYSQTLIGDVDRYYRIAATADWQLTCPPIDCALMTPYTETLCLYVRQVKRALSLNCIVISGFLIESLALHEKPRNAAALMKCLCVALRRGRVMDMYNTHQNLVTESMLAVLQADAIEKLYPLFNALING